VCEWVGEAGGLSAWSDVGEPVIGWVTADSRIDRIDEIDHIDAMSWLTTEIDPGEHSRIECIRSRTLWRRVRHGSEGTSARE